MSKMYDGPGGSVEVQESHDVKTKVGGTWKAPESVAITYHGSKTFVPVESLRFLFDVCEAEPDLAHKIRGH